MSRNFELSIVVDSGGASQKVAISTTSAQSTAISTTDNTVLVTPDTTCFVRQGSNPTAVSDGTDIILLANNQYRLSIGKGNKLAFITASGSGFVYITPGA